MKTIKKLVGKMVEFVRNLEDEGFFEGDSSENTNGLSIYKSKEEAA